MECGSVIGRERVTDELGLIDASAHEEEWFNFDEGG